ncbi:HMG box domain-containing protein [Mycena indigotica]|uniref:HMG box domain-containing protein n=1 Tax=Mycena indigotica TaxID=2126181 RepID=A0A8H6TIX0_9AGAR|nr:HMG box domain-containing protein [Mycena indigotica]KAF7316555.1 HMG box domain-containing protein [Mycena indigotica]
MPAVRLSSRRASAIGRRRSSLANSFAKPGSYGYNSSSPPATTVTFAPNVTPTTYSAPSPTPSPFGSPSLSGDMPLPIFPPSETPAPPPTRKRQPPGKRRSQGYIPRPPNAFMLFRADFVRQKHVPGTIETNHGSLSKIIGNCWRALPLHEKHMWEVKAKHAKAEHKLKYPDYKFRPVHNKQRGATAASASRDSPAPRVVSGPIKGQLSPEEDERRCEEVAALLLQGKKGQELASAVRDLDERLHPTLVHSTSSSPGPGGYDHNPKFPHPLLHLDPAYYPDSPPSSTLASSQTSGSPFSLPLPLHQEGREDPRWRHRRSSSVPLPNDYSVPFFDGGLTLPPLSSQYSFPPPASAAEDSLSGMPMSISDNSRMSMSWMNGTGSFSYLRPSFSFGFGDRQSFSFGGAYGGWSNNNNVSIGHRRASSAQAFFRDPSQIIQQQQHVEEELPDADTSLFQSGYMNPFASSIPAPAPTRSPVNEGVSPFDSTGILHAPQPIHPVSPLGDIEFQPPVFTQQPEPAAYAPFEYPTDDQPLNFQSTIRTGTSMDISSKGFEEVSYAAEFA